MNRVELAATGTELKPLAQPEVASPVLTPIITALAAGAVVGATAYTIHHLGYDSKYEAPASHDGRCGSASELLRVRQEQMAG